MTLEASSPTLSMRPTSPLFHQEPQRRLQLSSVTSRLSFQFAVSIPKLPVCIPSSYGQRHGPTANFLEQCRKGKLVTTHPNPWQYLKDDYIAELDRDILPRILRKEEDYLDSHVPLYSAISREVFLLHVINRAFLSMMENDLPHSRDPKDITWLRNPLETLPRYLAPDAPNFLMHYKGRINDHQEDQRWNLISCNTSLFSNTLEDAMESSIDYFWDNYNSTTLNIEERTRDAFEHFMQLQEKTQKNGTEKFLWQAKTALNRLEGKRGIMYQLFVPHAEVNNIVYISQPLGVPDSHHPDPLSTLLTIQCQHTSTLHNYHNLQARIIAGRFIDPRIVADYRTEIHTDCDLEQIVAFEDTICHLVDEIESDL